jgi:phosphocarrier protein HPr
MVNGVFKAQIRLENRLGMHARVAFALSSLSKRFYSDVKLGFGRDWADAKDITGILVLGICDGDEVTLLTEGTDAETALMELKKFMATEAKIL